VPDISMQEASTLKNLTILGEGAHGCVYDLGNRVLKITNHCDEYFAALRLMAEPRPWACTIHSAIQIEENEYHIVREKITPFLSRKHGSAYPGHFEGILYQEGEYKGLATRPVETNGFDFAYNNDRPLKQVVFDEGQLRFLSSLYADKSREQACFTWFMVTVWEARNHGFFTADLWSNIGQRDDGTYVIFDVMLPENALMQDHFIT
jgi:hypothetical protein